MKCPKCSSEYKESNLACPECRHSVLKIRKAVETKPAIQATANILGSKPGQSNLYNNLLSYMKTNQNEEYSKNLSERIDIGGMRAFGKGRPADLQTPGPTDVATLEKPSRESQKVRSSPIQKFALDTKPIETESSNPPIEITNQNASKPPRKKRAAKFDLKKQIDSLFSSYKPTQTYDSKKTPTPNPGIPPAPGANFNTTPPQLNQSSEQAVNYSAQTPVNFASPRQAPISANPQIYHAPVQTSYSPFPPQNDPNAGQPTWPVPGEQFAEKPAAGYKPGPPQQTMTAYALPTFSANSGVYTILGVIIFMILGILGLLFMVNIQ